MSQEYTNISNLPTMAEVTSPAYVPVEDTNKQGKKVDLSNYYTKSQTDSGFVSSTGYVATDNNYTTAEKNKLDGIESGAQVNVKPDWNAEAGTSSEILNKPTIPSTGYTRITRQVSPQYHDTGIFWYTYTINVNNREAITATLDKRSSNYSKGIILELSDDCDDAIICINTNENDDVHYGFCKRGSNSLIQILPVIPTIDNYGGGDILASNNYGGSGYEVPTDWSDVKLLDQDAKIATFDNQYGKLYAAGSELTVKQFVVRIIADCAFYYPVEWEKAD